MGNYPLPTCRRLKGYAFDPSLSLRLDTVAVNDMYYEIPWEEKLQPGPVGTYLEVIDYDPSIKKYYGSVDLNDPRVLASNGLEPSVSNPLFHQQMVYAVAMTTITNFERGLGRKIIWAERKYRDPADGNNIKDEYVERLRIYPHALREANAYYSPNKKALLFGYFNADPSDSGLQMPNSLIFTCLSHDIIAHEITHAILDSLFPKYNEPTNPDVLAFHEAFSDIVALFQHFSFPEVLKHQIAKTRGDLSSQNLLGQLAQEFGTAVGSYGSLRDAIGHTDPDTGEWKPSDPDPLDYQNEMQPHKRGSILVAAVFDAFLNIYHNRVSDLFRIYTKGSGVLGEGELHPDMVNRLSSEAAKASQHVLNMCIRALDYCPPVDLTFGDYLRALITADKDLVQDDSRSYRIAFIDAFRKRGIYPENIRALSIESLIYDEIDFHNIRENQTQWLLEVIGRFLREYHRDVMYPEEGDKRDMRRRMYDMAKDYITGDDEDIMGLHERLIVKFAGHSQFEKITGLAFNQYFERYGINEKGYGSIPGPAFQIENLRIVSRSGPKDNHINHVVFNLIQTANLKIKNGDDFTYEPGREFRFRGGCTLIFDLDSNVLRYSISKPILGDQKDDDGVYQLNMDRLKRQHQYQLEDRIDSMSAFDLNFGFQDQNTFLEPFAFLHNQDNQI